nr:SpoIIE family protein phosphatase [bacterium]
GSNIVYTIHEDRYGNLWFARGQWPVGGVSLLDGKGFVNFTTQDGLMQNYVEAIHEDQRGNLWFGEGGTSCYDGMVFVNYTEKDGLLYGIHSICEDGQGYLWFGTLNGIFRYDGKEFVNYTPQDGLGYVPSIYEDQQGYLWFGTNAKGILRYDGKEFINYTEKDGLPCNRFWWGIHEDSQGHLWFGTVGGGVAQYDGVAFQSLDVRDGLGGNTVYGICEDSDGFLWFGTDGGATRYKRDDIPPIAKIVSVTTDKTYTDLDAIPSFTAGTRVTIEYSSIDFKTHPDKRLYRYQMKGHDDDWSRATRETQVDYSNLKPGQYTFVAQAIDRDLNYSEPVSLTLKFVPPFYMSAGFLVPTLGFGTILIAVLTIVSIGYVKRRRQVQAYQQAAVRELQDAQQVQMSLMPDSAPPIEGVEIAGKCIPANTVSGDFFDYLEDAGQNEIALVVADVTGKAMKGAMNAVMADGILRATGREQVQFTPASLMMTLNDVLKGSMEWGMNVTMVIGMINAESKTLTIANAAHHAHPLLLRRPPDPTSGGKGEIQTLKTGGLPLGMRAGVRYSEEQFQLQSGDVVIFMTDGIIEAQDSEEQLYSDSGRLEETISQFTLDLSAEAMVEAILNDAMNFGGDKSARDDDMTVVVAKIQ